MHADFTAPREWLEGSCDVRIPQQKLQSFTMHVGLRALPLSQSAQCAAAQRGGYRGVCSVVGGGEGEDLPA